MEKVLYQHKFVLKRVQKSKKIYLHKT